MERQTTKSLVKCGLKSTQCIMGYLGLRRTRWLCPPNLGKRRLHLVAPFEMGQVVMMSSVLYKCGESGDTATKMAVGVCISPFYA